MCLWERAKESERTHTSVSPGDVAKNKQLLKPSGVWAASVCSPPPSLRPSSPHLPSLHLSITHTHTHSTTAHSYAPITVYTNAHTHQLHPAASLLYFLRRRPPVWQSAAQEKRARDTEKRLKKGRREEVKNRVRCEKRGVVWERTTVRMFWSCHLQKQTLKVKSPCLITLTPFAGDFRVVAASKRALSVDVGPEAAEENCVGRGRVAQLMKTFSVSSESPPSQMPPRANKPPIPEKPNHLRLRPSPSLR